MLIPLLALAILASGCSFLFVSGPPPLDERVARFDCTTSVAAPVIDGTLAALQILSTFYTASKTDAEVRADWGIPRDNAIGLGISWAIVYTASAVYGASKVSSCRDALGTDEPPRRGYRPPAESRQRRDEEAAEEAAVRARAKVKATATPPTGAGTGTGEGLSQPAKPTGE